MIQAGPLFTDFYQLTMAASYFEHHKNEFSTFSLFIRPQRERGYYVMAGLEEAIEELSHLSFSDDEIEYLRENGSFSEEFLEYLKTFRFTGSVHAMPEGTIFFGNEPILEVTAPIMEAQLVETFLINTICFQVAVATKASRCVFAAGDRPLIDFSLRRTQGRDAGMKVARDSYIAGFAGTSNVLAGKTYGIPVSGTMAHSFVTSFNSEIDSFRAFAETFPDNSVFLIDTYNTVEGAKLAAKVAHEMKDKGLSLKGVRLDSGDMAELSQKVRKVFVEEGLPEIKIFASSGFEEYKITDVLERGGEIDAFGVGTKLGVASDTPYLDAVYKMVKYGNRNVRKLSPGKITLAGCKQVFRVTGHAGNFERDIIGTREEKIEGATPLMEKVMDAGQIVKKHPSLEDIRNRFLKGFGKLDKKFKLLENHMTYPVSISENLQALQR